MFKKLIVLWYGQLMSIPGTDTNHTSAILVGHGSSVQFLLPLLCAASGHSASAAAAEEGGGGRKEGKRGREGPAPEKKKKSCCVEQVGSYVHKYTSLTLSLSLIPSPSHPRPLPPPPLVLLPGATQTDLGLTCQEGRKEASFLHLSCALVHSRSLGRRPCRPPPTPGQGRRRVSLSLSLFLSLRPR